MQIDTHPGTARYEHNTTQPLPVRLLERSPDLRVLYISGDSGSPSHVYRVENMARGLEALGTETEIVQPHELWRIIDRVHEFHAVIIWRLAIGAPFAWTKDIEHIISTAEKAGTIVFFDVDDLVFDPEICNATYVDGLRHLPPQEVKRYDESVRGYRDLMLRSGNALVTTEVLRDFAEKFGVNAFVVPNGLDANYEKALNRVQWPAPPLAAGTLEPVVIGYTPGSRTHQKDFAAAARALARVLGEKPYVQLRILGLLNLAEFPELLPFVGSQIIQNEAVGRDHVFHFNQQIDINIAPLELDNPFTAAKSELKYFEPAVFGVPVVASRVGPFAECVEPGKNGFLAETEEEWYQSLLALVSDRKLRHEAGAAARAQVSTAYTAEVIARRLLSVIKTQRDRRRGALLALGDDSAIELWPTVRNHQSSRPITVNWIIAGIIIGGGGHRNIFRAAYHLSRFGHRVRLYFTDTDEPVWKLRNILRKHFYPLDCPIYHYRGAMLPADVTFGTYWKTVDIALKHIDSCPNPFYFVQDFEPMFFPMSSDYIAAENTYRHKNLYAITSGPWCTDVLRQRYDMQADSFTFPIEDIYEKRPRTKANMNITFFAKPEMPRRCYEVGIEVLKVVHARRPDVEIILFGSRHVTSDNVPFPTTCRGILPTVSDLVDLYSNADLGIVFSTTNPSLVPFEMLKCGLPVVDFDLPGADVNYGGRRDIAYLGNLLPDKMAEEVIALLDNPEERRMRSENGMAFTAGFPDEESMARRIETLIVKRLTEQSVLV